jgi:hypothetical protein
MPGLPRRDEAAFGPALVAPEPPQVPQLAGNPQILREL